MATWQITDASGTREVTNPDAETIIDESASQLEGGLAPVVLVRAPSGAELGFAAGDPSVLTFQSGDEPRYFMSRGATLATKPLVFHLQGHWTEFPDGAAISLHDAGAALAEFLDTEERPNAVAWDEV